MMKRIAGWFGVACLLMATSGAGSPQRIDARTLGSDDVVVVGRLGHPLGTVVVVEAALQYEVRLNRMVRDYRLVVYRVNGVDLPEPLSFTYRTDVGSGVFGVPKSCVTLTEEDLKQPEDVQFRKGKREESPDTRHVLWVSEAAEFSGRPANLPPGMRTPLPYEWQFSFFTELVVHHEDAVTRFTTRLPPERPRVFSMSGRAPETRDEFWKGVWSVLYDRDPWITTQPEGLARTLRSELLAGAGREGLDVSSLERSLVAWTGAVGDRGGVAVPVGAFLMTPAEGDVEWVIMWKEFRWSDDPAHADVAGATAAFGSVRCATALAEYFAVVHAGDGRVLRAIELSHEIPGD